MTQLVLIGVTGRRAPMSRYVPSDAVLLGDQLVDVHFAAFGAQLAAAGALTVNLHRESDPAATLARLDGLLLSGGEDVDPALSGADRAEAVDAGRDAFELALLEVALARELPVLGVCRGMQVLNVGRGGTLASAPAGHNRIDAPFATLSHAITCPPGTLGHRLLGRCSRVNSTHRQAVARLGAGLEIAASAPDGTVEAVWWPGRDVLGVQWHPEFLDAPHPAFSWLAAAARKATVEVAA